jgi:hypothetical protein
MCNELTVRQLLGCRSQSDSFNSPFECQSWEGQCGNKSAEGSLEIVTKVTDCETPEPLML